MSRKFWSAAAAAAALMFTAAPAHAGAVGEAGSLTMSVGGNYAGVLTNGGATVAYECHAEAPAAISIAITLCKMTTGGNNSPLALPGSAAATAGVAAIPFGSTQLCWSATATFVDAVTKTKSGCTVANTGLAGAGLTL